MYRIYSLEKIEERYKNIYEIDKEFIKDSNGRYYVVKNSVDILGYALILENNRCYEIKRIFIRAGVRYSSYGIKLVKFIINDASKNNIEKIICRSESIGNFLKKNNFQSKDGMMVLENVQKGNNRTKDGMRVAMSSIIQNILLALLKICGGIYGNSRALVSDGINSLADVGSSTAIFFGLYYSNQPADEAHPYGHEKIESIIANIIGVLMLLTAFELGKDSVMVLLKGEYGAIPNYITIIFAGISMIVKFFMYRYKLKVGKKSDNSALIADAMDSKNDVYSSGGVILGILLSIFISPVFDVLISIVVALLIFKEGISIIFESSNLILDKQDEEFIQEVERYIYQNTTIKNIHDLYMRKSGDKIFLTFHMRLPRETTIYEAHSLAENLQNSIILDFENVKEVMIHIDYLL